MATYVLIHGGWGSGWEWTRVADRLAAIGHRVYRPSLTGFGERRHLSSPDIDLNTHIQDVVSLFEAEDLSDAILCGQSYAGMILSGVAQRIPDRIARFVYLDGFVPDDGESVMDLLPPGFADQMRSLAKTEGDGWLIPLPFPMPGPGEAPPEVTAYLAKASTPTPLGCYETPLPVGSDSVELPATYIRCTQIEAEDFLGNSAARARTRGWDYLEIDAPHDAHYFAAETVAEVLLSVL